MAALLAYFIIAQFSSIYVINPTYAVTNPPVLAPEFNVTRSGNAFAFAVIAAVARAIGRFLIRH
jgi:hypothetical protein